LVALLAGTFDADKLRCDDREQIGVKLPDRPPDSD
jgi:hypothetical protein